MSKPAPIENSWLNKTFATEPATVGKDASYFDGVTDSGFDRADSHAEGSARYYADKLVEDSPGFEIVSIGWEDAERHSYFLRNLIRGRCNGWVSVKYFMNVNFGF